MSNLRRRYLTWFVGVSVLLLSAGFLVFVVRNAADNGDPGGKVMKQLVPAVSALPGHGTSALPWVSQIPGSLVASYAITIEPSRDSCDGKVGTQGWSPVVVQAGFTWTRSVAVLNSYISPRLAGLGWSTASKLRDSRPSSQNWTKILDNGSKATITLTQGMGEYASQWQFVAVANPFGKVAGGC